jgi:hypothetical protein
MVDKSLIEGTAKSIAHLYRSDVKSAPRERRVPESQR